MLITRKSKIILSLSFIGWMVAIGAGMRFILNYENTPGRSGASPATWATGSRIQRTEGLPTLVMMIHPHCPCSRASIGELALVMTEVQGLVAAHVIFVKPQDFLEEWEKTDLWSSASRIPGIQVRVDDKGVEARRFESRTSGQTLLYNADGQLLFSGGITAARGHSGDNDGRSAIASLLTRGSAEQKETPVFGCPLFEDATNELTRDSGHASHNN